MERTKSISYFVAERVEYISQTDADSQYLISHENPIFFILMVKYGSLSPHERLA